SPRPPPLASTLFPYTTLFRSVLVVMRDLAREGMTMVIVTHEMGFAREAATRVLFLDRGRAVETGAPDRFFSNPETERARQFLQRSEEHTSELQSRSDLVCRLL